MSRHIKKIKDIIFFNKKVTNNIVTELELKKDREYLAIYNPENIGIMNSTIDLFGKENSLALGEILNKKQEKILLNKFKDLKVKQIIFSSITFGIKSLIERIHIIRPDIKLSFFWHGAHPMLIQQDEPYFFYMVLDLLNSNVVDKIAFAKESMAIFYKEKGYNSYFLPNTIKSNIIDEMNINNAFNRKNDNTYIGIYSAGERWEKNTFNQLSAASMIKKSVIDILPITKLVKSFCKLMKITLNDEKIKYMSREKLLARMKCNDVNLYVTFTECSPMLPLESLEVGVPCITGNNHHYFKNTKLFDYLVVNSEDNIDEIVDKINLCLNNKDDIINLYKKWKVEYDLFVKDKFKEFIDI
ncbi:MAG: glycosyltransferase [Clostridia bacterium]